MTKNENNDKQTVFKENEDVKQGGVPQITKTSTGLEQNLAGLLAYLLGFVSGIIFLLLEKDNRFVRYHAIQSIIVSVALIIVSMVLTAIPFIGWLLGILLSPISLVLWIYLMWQAYNNKYVKLPVISQMTENMLDK